jgi:uncharacterized protein (DUF2384 family)
MSTSHSELFATVPSNDPLNFWSGPGQQLDYRRVSEFLDLDANELSKLGGVSKKSVRFDERIPHELSVRLEQIAVICARVANYFGGDAEKTALWFRLPNPMLGEISPRDMIRYGRFKKLMKFIMDAMAGSEVES